MTTPLARMVATRLKADKGIKRLFYIANVFRHEQTQAGRQCEFSQAGIELIGAAAPMADAEVLALAVSSLRAAGLTDFLLSVGHSGFLAGLMEEAELTGTRAEFVKHMVLSHNAVGLKEAADSYIRKPVKDCSGSCSTSRAAWTFWTSWNARFPMKRARKPCGT